MPTHAEQLFDGAGVLRAWALELLGAGENLEPRLVLRAELAEKVLVEPVQALERVEHRVAGPHAEEQRDLAEACLQVDDQRLPLGEPRELDGAVHGHGRRAGAALGAEEDHRHRRRLGLGVRAVAARRRPPHRALERVFRHRPHEELVGAGAHRLQDQLGIGRLGDGEDRRRRQRRAQPFDRRHARRGVATDVHGDEIRRRLLAGRTSVFEQGDRDAARSQKLAELAAEFVVLRDDQRSELGHWGATPRGGWLSGTRRRSRTADRP